jgi:hypothetical protein
MNIYIPIVKGQDLCKGVENSILNQSIPCKIHIISGDGDLNSSRNYSPLRLIEEPRVRNECRATAMWYGDNYSVIQDRDCKHLYDENILDMMSFLQDNPLHGAVSIGLNYGDQNHICLICVMFRWDALAKLNFHNKYGKCLCQEVTEDIRNMGYKYGYLDNKKRIVEIKE